MTEPLLCDLSVPGRVGFRYPKPDVPLEPLPEGFVRTDLPLPSCLSWTWSATSPGCRSSTTASTPASTRWARAR